MAEQETLPTKQYTIIQGVQVRACELRLERPTPGGEDHVYVEYLCGASGGHEQGTVLGNSDEGGAAVAVICNSCPIPDVLESKCSCLQLVPVRHFTVGKHPLPVVQCAHSSGEGASDESANVYFPCRWFYTLYGQHQPQDMLICQSCPYWFPHPPVELIPHYWETTQKMLRIVTGEEQIEKPVTNLYSSKESPPAKTLWENLRRKIHF
jgi:hypothetical protein